MLSEPQIQRFSRQILLREVGGRGQERLLSTPIKATGQGAAFDAAVESLVAGGSPVERSVGAGARFELPNGRVTLDGATLRWSLGCEACVASSGAPNDGPESTLLGSLTALAVQRLVLGLAAQGGIARWAAGVTSEEVICPHGVDTPKR